MVQPPLEPAHAAQAVIGTSRLLRDMYRMPPAETTEVAREQLLGRLSLDLPFHSALWTFGTLLQGQPVFHALHLRGQPRDMLIDYESLKSHDSLAIRVFLQSGRCIRLASREGLPAVWQSYLDRYNIEHAAAIVQRDMQSGLVSTFSLYRGRGHPAFSEFEAALVEAVVPHLNDIVQARELSILGRELPLTDDRTVSAACDHVGRLLYAEHAFVRVLNSAWPDWRGPDLPIALQQTLSADQSMVEVEGLIVQSNLREGLVRLVRLRKRNLLDTLTPHQRDVARLAMRGLSHKQIAAELSRAPATVRNQLAAVYERLGVTNRIELLHRMHE